jgi:hypothetical protein
MWSKGGGNDKNGLPEQLQHIDIVQDRNVR